MSCLDEQRATDLVLGRLDEPDADEARDHIASCGGCQALVDAVADEESQETSARELKRDTTKMAGSKAGANKPEGPAPGAKIAGRYQLVRELGRGGMGEVWEALDAKLERPVAIKLLTAKSSDNALARFEREAMAIAKLRSPCIVEIYDYGVEQDRPYIVMELLDGHDLKRRLDEDGPMPLGVAAQIVIEVAKALGTAHDAGIVHRDLKPANIFLVRQHGEESIKVIDFGVAKALRAVGPSTDTTAEGVVLGTPRYMSPEQVHGALKVDHRADLWALGIIAYTLLYGRAPFRAKGVGAMIAQILHDEPKKLSALVAGCDARVDAFFARALAKSPDDRFQSAKEMAAAMAALADLALSAREFRAAPADRSQRVAALAESTVDNTFDAATRTVAEAERVAAPRRIARGPLLLACAAALVGVGMIAWLSMGGSSEPTPAASGAASVATSAPASPSDVRAPEPAPRDTGTPAARVEPTPPAPAPTTPPAPKPAAKINATPPQPRVAPPVAPAPKPAPKDDPFDTPW